MSKQAPGFAPWKPAKRTRAALEQVLDVIEDGREHWPLSQRYWLYRLIAKHGWRKWDEYSRSRARKNGYANLPREPYNLNNILDRGRRAGLIPWEAVTSSRGVWREPDMIDTPEELADVLTRYARAYQFDRQAGQVRRVALWMETEGLAQSATIAAVAREYGALLLAGQGFDTIGAKHNFAQLVADQGDVLILHCGDLDKSGDDVHRALVDDLVAFAEGLGGQVRLRRIALTEDQVEEYGLESKPATPGLNSGNHGAHFASAVECQLEAMDFDDLAAIIRDAFEQELDMDVFRRQVAAEDEKRGEALRLLAEQ